MLGYIARCLGIFIKKAMGRTIERFVPVNLELIDKWPLELQCNTNGYINDISCQGRILLRKSQVFPKDNAVSHNLRQSLFVKQRNVTLLNKSSLQTTCTSRSELLNSFIVNARIPKPWKYAGLYYTGYSLADQQYILPSWIWTNGIIVRHFSESGQHDAALDLANCLLEQQLDCGAWIVRYDYKNLEKGVSPVIAPNDSAHCADNGLLTAYRLTGDAKYLHAAEKCAQWIMREGNDNGLILHSYDITDGKWITNINIIDIGFSAGLFCSLWKLTGKREYIDFAEKFISRYIKVFYRGNGIFATSIVGNKQMGKGIFARGHAWALEGMIPYYELSNDPSIGKIVDDTVLLLLKYQQTTGGWLYNLRSGPVGWYSGYDNKGISVIATSLSRWKKSRPKLAVKLDTSVRSSIHWCLKHIRKQAQGQGGIFSCNFEGAVVHSPNTEVAFVYSNCYLLSLMREYKVDYV